MKNKLFIILLSIASLSACKKENTTVNTSNDLKTITVDNTQNTIKDGKHCYQFILDNSYKEEGKRVNQKDYININLDINGHNITGKYLIKSDQNIIINGDLLGTIDNNNIITCIHKYQKNKKVLKDEMVFKIIPNSISILGGEKKMINDVNVFIDKSKGDYMMELTKIDCN